MLSIALSLLFTVHAHAAPRCQAKALKELKLLDPHGYSIYLSEKSNFTDSAWWNCDDYVQDLDTAVHETIHLLSAEKNAYQMIDGTLLARAPESSAFFPPSELAPQVDPKMMLSFYIIDNHKSDQPSSVTLFAYLLDELNAYSNGLYTTNRMISLKTGQDDSRDGIMGFMHFLELYATRAKTVRPRTWAAMNANPVRASIQKLWTQAESVAQDACRLKVSGIEDIWYVQKLCAPSGHEAMTSLLGRAPICPALCLH